MTNPQKRRPGKKIVKRVFPLPQKSLHLNALYKRIKELTEELEEAKNKNIFNWKDS